MARTKQTARKSTGGKAPRKQLATTSARKLRQFCTSQQNVGKSTTTRTDKTSYINHENTLGAFTFEPTTSFVSSSFEPLVSSAHDRGETWIGVNFRSVFDGTEGAAALRPRVRLRLVVSVDISGSMSSSFENDVSGSRSQKIDVAKKCLMAIAAQLEPDDELGVVLFNHDSKVLIPLRTGTGSHASRVTALKNALCNVHAGGGTNLERGFKAGLDLLSRPQGSTSSASPPPPLSSAAVEALQTGDERTVVSRCVFMTDMQSSQSDEDAVLAAAAAASAAVGGAAPVFTTVVGIGVDLSVGAVQSLSRTVGGRYASVCSAAEFERVTGEASSLVHDCVPVAYSISCSIRGGGGGGGGGGECVLLGGCGHPEAATLTPGSSTVTFSSEFATSGEGQPPILLRLSAPLLAASAGDEPVTVEFQWQNWDGTPGFASVSPPAPSLLPAPPPSSSSSSSSTETAGAGHPTVLSPWSAPLPHGLTGESVAAVGGAASERFFSDLNIRKALALTRFVDFQEVYMTDDRKDDYEDDDGEQTYPQPFRGRAQFRGRGGSVGRFASGHSFAIPQPSSSSSSSLSAQERAARLRARAGVAARWAERAAEAKAALEAEVAGACGDMSVLSGGENQAFSDTLKQIVDLEGKDAEVLIKRAEELEAASEQAPSAARGKRSRSSSSKTVLLTGIEETGQRRGRDGSDDEGSGSRGDEDDHQSRAAKKRSEGVTAPALGAPAAPSSGFGCVLS